MDLPIASLMIEGFCKGFEMRAKKEEEEAEEILSAIDYSALKPLCVRYDNKTGEYPEHEHEGAAVFEFFEKLKDGVENKKKKGEEK